MSEWVNSTVGQVTAIQRAGGTPTATIDEYYGGDIPFVTIEDITNSSRFLDKTEKQLSAKGLTNSAAWLIKEPHILYSMYATVGKPIINRIQCATNQAIIALKESPVIDQTYLYYQLLFIRQQVYKFTSQTTQSNLNAGTVKRLPIAYPKDIGQQQKISAILTSIDISIEKTESLIAKYQQIKAGLMHDLFTRGVSADGKLRPPREQAPELYQETSIGWIPKEWKIKPLGVLAEIVSGITLGAKGEISDEIGVPYLRVANVQDGYFDLTEVKTVRVSRSQFEKLQLRYGDVLMNEGGDFDKLGRGSVWQEEIKPCIHQNHVFRVRPRDGQLRSYFLAFWSQSEMGKKYFVLSSKQSTNLASINSTQLNQFPVALPLSIEQERIEARIVALNGRAASLGQELAKLRLEKHGLMHDLLTGRMRVKFAETEVVLA
ncbi:MAG: restriction endonuclease subunit S [Gallionella sp.]